MIDDGGDFEIEYDTLKERVVGSVDNGSYQRCSSVSDCNTQITIYLINFYLAENKSKILRSYAR